MAHNRKTQIMVNGNTRKEIVIRRELRQEDPLSLLLYILITNGLHNMFNKMKQEGLINELGSCTSSTFVNL